MKARIEKLPFFQQVNMGDEDYLMGLSFKHKGLDVVAPVRTYGGRKIMQKFLIPGTQDMGVCIEFEDVEADGVLTIRKHLKIFRVDDSIFCEKVEFDIVRNKEKLYKSRRQAAYDFLRASAKGTPIESHVNELLDHYFAPVQKWLLGDIQVWDDAILNETHPLMIAYLDIVTNPENGWTVRNSIISQIRQVRTDNEALGI